MAIAHSQLRPCAPQIDPLLLHVILAFARRDEEAILESVLAVVNKVTNGAIDVPVGQDAPDLKGMVLGVVTLVKSDNHTRAVALSQLLLASQSFIKVPGLRPEVLEAAVNAVVKRSEQSLFKLLVAVTASLPPPINKAVPVDVAALVGVLLRLRKQPVTQVLGDERLHTGLLKAVGGMVPTLPPKVPSSSFPMMHLVSLSSCICCHLPFLRCGCCLQAAAQQFVAMQTRLRRCSRHQLASHRSCFMPSSR